MWNLRPEWIIPVNHHWCKVAAQASQDGVSIHGKNEVCTAWRIPLGLDLERIASTYGQPASLHRNEAHKRGKRTAQSAWHIIGAFGIQIRDQEGCRDRRRRRNINRGYFHLHCRDDQPPQALGLVA